MNAKSAKCTLLEEYLDKTLSKQDQTRFADHLTKCVSCREQVRVSENVRAVFHNSQRTELPDDADLRIRIALRRERSASRPGKDVMNLEEAAAWLGIAPGMLAERLDEIPAFEIGGRIRFSRKRLEQWMEMKDGELLLQVHQARSRKNDNLLHFPGGKHGKQQSGNSGTV